LEDVLFIGDCTKISSDFATRCKERDTDREIKVKIYIGRSKDTKEVKK